MRPRTKSFKVASTDIDSINAKIQKNNKMLADLIYEAQRIINVVLVRSSPCAMNIIDLQTHECLKHNYERFYNRIKSLPRLDPFSGFWRDWLLVPGRDFRVRYNQFSGSHKVVNVNEVTTTMMTRIWIQATFLAMAKRHFSNETHYVEMPRFGLLRNSDQELILRLSLIHI